MTDRLCAIEVTGGAAPGPELAQDRGVAIFELLEVNRFALPHAPAGPYRLTLAQRPGVLAFDLATEAGQPAAAFQLSRGPLRQVVKDYLQVCASYYDAVKTEPPVRIEALDKARRAIHSEGAETLRQNLVGKAELDEATARRLFTLLCSLGPEAL